MFLPNEEGDDQSNITMLHPLDHAHERKHKMSMVETELKLSSFLALVMPLVVWIAVVLQDRTSGFKS